MLRATAKMWNGLLPATRGPPSIPKSSFHAKLLQRNADGSSVSPHPGGPFDLMSRRLIVASSRKIAERIAREIKEFEVGRDDAGGQ